VGSFGERLQRERELRSITLEEIAEATKIGTRSLRALEEQDFDKLPGGIFNKGFVRAYARYLGLDEEQAVADYLAALGEALAAGKATRQESTVNTTTPERNLLMNQVEESEPLRLPVGLIVVVVVIALVLFGGWKYFAKHGLPKLLPVRAANQQPSHPKTNLPAQAAPQPLPPIETPTPSQRAVEPATSKPAAVKPVAAQPASANPAAVKPVAAADSFVVRIKAKESSWVLITADGKLVIEGTLPVGAEKSIRAQHSVLVKAGDAAAIELFHNDKLVPPLGAAGEVKTVEFTSSGMRQ
jgi:cytoskeleton protein RodZ